MSRKQIVFAVTVFLFLSVSAIVIYKLIPTTKQSYTDIDEQNIVDLSKDIKESTKVIIDDVEYTVLSAELNREGIDNFLLVSIRIENLDYMTKTLCLGNHRIKISGTSIEPSLLNDKNISSKNYWRYDLNENEILNVKLGYKINEEYMKENICLELNPKGSGLTGISDASGNLKYELNNNVYQIDLTALLGENNEKNIND